MAKFIHRRTFLTNLRDNCGLSDGAPRRLDRNPTASDSTCAKGAILEYHGSEVPYYFTYRCGQPEGEAMERGVAELDRLAHWAAEEGYRLQAEAVRRYWDPQGGDRIVQRQRQREAKH
jgi:hypothetical protein